jgi:hypothetical protein
MLPIFCLNHLLKIIKDRVMKLSGMKDLGIWVCRMDLNISSVTLSSPEVNFFPENFIQGTQY